MFFTKEDIQKLKECLIIEGKKDTDFNEIDKANIEDLIAIVQNNENKKVRIANLLRGNVDISSLSQDLLYKISTIESRLGGIERELGIEPTLPPEAVWYIGQISKTGNEFSNLTVDELLAASRSYSLNVKEVAFVIHESCWFTMVPVGDVSKVAAAYTDGGLVSYFKWDEIRNGFISQVYHEPVYIDNKQYYVYVNRNEKLETTVPEEGMEKVGIEGRFRIELSDSIFG